MKKLIHASLLILLGASLFTSCGGKEIKKEGEGDLGMYADTNAGQSPGVQALEAEAAAANKADEGLKAEQMASANGSWKLTESGELVATLKCTYHDGSLDFEIVRANETKPVVKGSAASVNDSGGFDSQIDACRVQFWYDTKVMEVSLDGDCYGKSANFIGTYTR
jgi:hypothetical protein